MQYKNSFIIKYFKRKINNWICMRQVIIDLLFMKIRVHSFSNVMNMRNCEGIYLIYIFMCAVMINWFDFWVLSINYQILRYVNLPRDAYIYIMFNNVSSANTFILVLNVSFIITIYMLSGYYYSSLGDECILSPAILCVRWYYLWVEFYGKYHIFLIESNNSYNTHHI